MKIPFKMFGQGAQLSLSVLISAGAHLYQSKANADKARIEEQRRKLNEKIQGLYGPIVGNRIIHMAAIASLQSHFGKSLSEVVADICDSRKPEDLENWRSFYLEVLAPLDKELKDIVRSSSHLVRSLDDLSSLDEIVQVISLQEYRMEKWMTVQDGADGIRRNLLNSTSEYNDADWKPEVNCANFEKYTEFATKMKKINANMVEQRNAIDNGLMEDQQSGQIVKAFNDITAMMT